MARRREEEFEEEFDFRTYIKGIIAVMVTILIVVIIVMLFAKSLLSTNSSTKAVKTGHLTETAYIDVEAVEAKKEELVEMTTTTTNENSADEDEDEDDEEEEETSDTSLPEGLDTSVAGEYTINSAVYLHPEANSSSSNIATIPSGTTVTVYGYTNYGWYYLDYNGQKGYAWKSYLTKK